MSSASFFGRLYATFVDEQQNLNALDAAVGDGDHGAAMVRGLAAAKAAPDGDRAKAFMRASGGASGTLFGLILHEIERYGGGDGGALADHLSRATERIIELGEAVPGDKTMIDALAPAVATLRAGGSLSDAAEAAADGRDATIAMAARRGRARYIENRGVGYPDPGACSIALFLGTLAVTESGR